MILGSPVKGMVKGIRSGLWICEFQERSLNSVKALLEARVVSGEPLRRGRQLRISGELA